MADEAWVIDWTVSVDATVDRAHQHAAGARHHPKQQVLPPVGEPADHALGRSLVPRPPGRGRPRTRPEEVLADRAYSSRGNRAHLRRRGIRATIPNKVDQLAHRRAKGSAGGRPPAFDRERCKQRHAVECGINRHKQSRAFGTAWAAHRAARETRDAGLAAASAAARAAGAAFLHPLAKDTQVRHVLGSAASAARAIELSAEGDPAVGANSLTRFRMVAGAVVVDVLRCYPPAPSGGERVGELLRHVDAALR
ncbi:hypothetical protein ACI797_21055 [Geodermatophilus sp. SYSU D00691]